MVRQVIHRRIYPIRKSGGRRSGTYAAGSKKATILKRKPRVFIGFHNQDRHAKELLLAQAKNRNINL